MKKAKIEKVHFNEKRALEVLPILADLWRRREGVFKGERLPQELWEVKGDPEDVARYYFYASHTMRGGIVSEDPFRWILSLREHFPDAFRPHEVAQLWTPNKLKLAAQEITKHMIVDGVRYETKGTGALGFKFDELAEHWCHNSKVIADNWGGNVLNIFDGVSDFEELFGRIDNKKNLNGTGIKGMRRKIFSLFTIFLQERDLVPRFPTPIPVDFHALRVLWETGVIDIVTKPLPVNDRYPKMLHGFPSVGIDETVTDAVAMWSQGFLSKHGLSHMEVNPALWVLSRKLCAEHFQNISRDKGKTFVLPEDLKRNQGLWPKKYRDPCGLCPVQSFCTKMIPAAIYYDVGKLVPIERVHYPQKLLDGLDWQHHIIPKSRKGRAKGNTKNTDQ